MSTSPVSAGRQLSIIEGAAGHHVSGPEGPISPELFRQMFVSLDLPDDAGPVIAFTSALAGEGRTTAALGLAQTLATDLDPMVLLVDASFDRPALHSELNIPLDPGLAGVMRGEVALEDVMYKVSETLVVVPAGSAQGDSSRLLRQLGEFDYFMSMREQGVVTILDLPPILDNSYSAIAASAVDAVVLVIRAGVTPAGVVSEALDRSKVMPQGVVLNGQQTARPPWRLRRRRR